MNLAALRLSSLSVLGLSMYFSIFALLRFEASDALLSRFSEGSCDPQLSCMWILLTKDTNLR